MELLQAALESASVPEPNTGCWLWMRGMTACGYGSLAVARMGIRENRANRLAWMAAHGRIPKGMHVLHRCDTRACVNPDHLFLGSNRDNVADRVAKGRSDGAKGIGHGMSKLTDEAVREIRASDKPSSELARQFGVHRMTIRRVRYGRSWLHVSAS